MPSVATGLAARVTLGFALLALAAPACAPGTPDGIEESADNDHEGLTGGSLPAGTTLRTTTDVNFRSGPSTSNSVLAVLPTGTTVTLVDAAPSNGFYHISHGGQTGWTSGSYLEPTSDGTSGPTTTSTLVTTTDVNLRSGPSTANSVLTVIPSGSEVSVLSPDPVSGFYHVSYQGMTGYCSGKYLGPKSGPASFAGGKVWKFRAQTLPVDVAVFVPAAAEAAPEVDVVVYAHGLNVCSPVATNPPLSFVTDAPFHLAEVVAATGRPVVLAAPFFDWEHLAANGMAVGGKHHKLGIPANLNGVVAEVLAQVGKERGADAPALGSFVVAGHSRAYDFLNPLATAHTDPQMSAGALAHLTGVWGLDTGYVCSPIQDWSGWIAAKPGMAVTMIYRPGTDTAACGQAFAQLAPSTGGRLVVHAVSEEHCAVPGKELPSLLGGLP